jgi:trans-aconitate methyltransferase
MGYGITALDPGKHMLEMCRQNLHAYPDVNYECSLFEAWDPKGRLFDLIISGTAFHWIPADGQRKLSTLLNPEGAIAIFWHTFLNGQDEENCRFDDIYKAHSPENYVADFHASQEMFDRRREVEMLSLPRFSNWRVIRYYQTLLLDAPRYINLMKTWSTHRTSQESLFTAVKDAIERNGGKISKPVRTTLCLAQLSKAP